ncbi:hypothetical protein C943_00982 [Mariniradius saccharolyticus AK6]|uniref:Uncharacterized protein n=1 Tax=Mariniradius saccharolyticus AK6 TaxID=1239962 RepID=M7XCM5_9BACT|nr:hypothetical protein C943_00982 [Mariniradius saccharolyticus AK6]
MGGEIIVFSTFLEKIPKANINNAMNIIIGCSFIGIENNWH